MAYQIIKNCELIRQSVEDGIGDGIVAVKSRIVVPNNKKTLVYHKTVVDIGSDTSVISKSIANQLDMEIDKTNSSELSRPMDKFEVVGTVYGLGITIYDNDNSQTIKDDFIVINTDEDLVLLGSPWLDRTKAIIHLNSHILQIPISEKESIIAPFYTEEC